MALAPGFCLVCLPEKVLVFVPLLFLYLFRFSLSIYLGCCSWFHHLLPICLKNKNKKKSEDLFRFLTYFLLDNLFAFGFSAADV
jgi:hypothetical protein